MRIRAVVALAASICIALTTAGCGSDNADDSQKKDVKTTATGPSKGANDPAQGSAKGADPSKADAPTVKVPPRVEGEAGEKPQIVPGKGEPTKRLYSKVLIQGDGPTLSETDNITAHYIGQLWDGTQFDSSWDRQEPATFNLQGVIPGWTMGLAGKKVGDRVLLIIPPELGYGSAGNQSIPPNSTLVFVVDIVDRPEVDNAG
ncbi:MAG: FKBP-type peptidyl-prolyl cis-trans isomerase [Actinomycetaceae bacterium]|nr:FKBP-type peptidyl-prolyl cis-trans isomerase [Actinomycetaceae bacterium]